MKFIVFIFLAFNVLAGPELDRMADPATGEQVGRLFMVRLQNIGNEPINVGIDADDLGLAGGWLETNQTRDVWFRFDYDFRLRTDADTSYYSWSAETVPAGADYLLLTFKDKDITSGNWFWTFCSFDENVGARNHLLIMGWFLAGCLTGLLCYARSLLKRVVQPVLPD